MNNKINIFGFENFLYLKLINFIFFFQSCFLNFFSFSLIKTDKPKNILVFRVSALGDFIFSIPSYHYLRDNFPGSNIYLLSAISFQKRHIVAARNYAPQEKLPWLVLLKPGLIDRFVSISSSEIGETLRVRRIVKSLHIDACVILTHSGENFLSQLKKIVYLRAIGVTCKILGHKSTSNKSVFKAIQYNNNLFDHNIISSLKSANQLCPKKKLPINDIRFDINILPKSKIKISKIIKIAALKNKKIIILAPGSIKEHKKWPIENFVKLSELLVNKFNIFIFIIGTPSDSVLGDTLVNFFKKKNIMNLAGLISINESAELLANSHLLVGNDGGAMHLGASVGTNVVSIISGIEYPGSIEPWKNEKFSVRFSTPCSPCYSFESCPLHHNDCINKISVASVLKKCELALNIK